MLWFFLFLFGLAIGSFLNVVALRYDGEKFVFDAKMIGGRSYCPHCKKTLRWFELFPLLSFVIQGGRCRRCKRHISFQYPIVELISGFIFLLVPFQMGLGLSPVFWIAAFEILLLITLIDIRLGIVPDELNIILMVIGIFSLLLGWQGGAWIGRLGGAIFGGAFFGFLVFITPYIFKQDGMGMGDVKLAVPLGFLFGWPEMIFITALAFIIGAIVGLISIALKKNTMKGTLPFAPFLSLAAAIVFLFGAQMIAMGITL